RPLQTSPTPSSGMLKGACGPPPQLAPPEGTGLIKVRNNSPHCTELCGSGRQPSGLRAAPGRLKGVRGCMRGPKGEDRNSPWPPHKRFPLPKGLSGGNLPLIPPGKDSPSRILPFPSGQNKNKSPLDRAVSLCYAIDTPQGRGDVEKFPKPIPAVSGGEPYYEREFRRNRHDLLGLQRPCGKERVQAARHQGGQRKPASKFH